MATRLAHNSKKTTYCQHIQNKGHGYAPKTHTMIKHYTGLRLLKPWHQQKLTGFNLPVVLKI